MMNVQTICLAILQLGDATGYEIRKRVAEGHFSHFVEASYGSIYPALNKLESEGLLSARVEEQDGKPNRRVYSMTDAGRTELSRTFQQPARTDTFRSEFLFLAMFAEYLPLAIIRGAVEKQVKWLVAELDIIDAAEASVPLEAASWVAECGRTCLQSQLDYIYEHRDRLEALAGTASFSSPPVSPEPVASPLVAAE